MEVPEIIVFLWKRIENMVEIEQLPETLRNPDYINIREVPQLKYVVEMSKRLCPDVGFCISEGRFFC